MIEKFVSWIEAHPRWALVIAAGLSLAAVLIPNQVP